MTDNLTGLIWPVNAGCLNFVVALTFWDWKDASLMARNLGDGFCGPTDGSSPGDWRLATIAEWEEMVAAARPLGCWRPPLTNDAGDGCWTPETSSFYNFAIAEEFEWGWWSATTHADDPSMARQLGNFHGDRFARAKSVAGQTLVWPVRGGQ